jgi:phosphate transport system permease protein
MAIPLGILGGIYLNEYGGKNALARLIRFLSEVMTGVPSIVMGLFVYTFVVLNTQEKNGFAGALALACLMLPIVIRTTDQMLALVPAELREGSYALGSRRARTIRTVVLPSAAPGIVSGALLAVARAAGETAPLLFTVGLLEDHNNWNLFNGINATLSLEIFANARSLFPSAQDRAWAAAFTLILIVFVFTVLARLVTAFFGRRTAV